MYNIKKESPDAIDTGQGIVDYDEFDSIVFGYYGKKLYIATTPGTTHGKLFRSTPGNDGKYGTGNTRGEKSGRAWYKRKLISFWNYPKSNREMKRFAKELEEKIEDAFNIDIDIWNTFKVEIIVPKDMSIKNKKNVKFNDWGDEPVGYKTKLIPIKDFKSSKERDDKELRRPHVMSPVAKSTIVHDKIGSKKRPAGLTATQRHQLQRTSDGVIKLKKLVESPDKIETTSAHWYGGQSFGYHKGVMSVSDVGVTHNTFIGVDMNARYSMEYSGRIWPKQYILSFWKYPETTEKMKEVVADIQKVMEDKYNSDADIWLEYNVEIIVPQDAKNDDINDVSVKFSNDSDLPSGYTTEIIPLRNYVTSEDVDEKTMSLSHTMSPMQKRDVNVSPGWGSKKRPAGLSATQRRHMKMTSDSVIKLKGLAESPDKYIFSADGDYLSHGANDAYAFGYYEWKLYISNAGRKHYEMNDDFGLGMDGEPRYEMKYAGRFWSDQEIITFWEYPEDSAKMRKVANDINKKFNEEFGEQIDVWNNFDVEIFVDKDSNKPIKSGNEIEYPHEYNNVQIMTIPVKQYESSLGHSKADILTPHVMSPMQKNKHNVKLKSPGFGADKRFQLPTTYSSKVGKGFNVKDVPPAIKHQMKYTSDSVIKLKGLIETTIARLSKNINVRIDVDKTAHANQQQNRPEGTTSDTEIIEIVNLALPKIADDLIFDKINMGDYVLVKHKGTDINIVGALHPGKNEEIDFVVVTVMKKQNFMPKRGTKVIEV